MEERIGSFVKDEKGNVTPNLGDEAMAEREKKLKAETNAEVKKNGKK